VILIDVAIATAIGLAIEIAGLVALVALLVMLAGFADLMDWLWPR
jgi:hypothetical protein